MVIPYKMDASCLLHGYTEKKGRYILLKASMYSTNEKKSSRWVSKQSTTSELSKLPVKVLSSVVF